MLTVDEPLVNHQLDVIVSSYYSVAVIIQLKSMNAYTSKQQYTCRKMIRKYQLGLLVNSRDKLLAVKHNAKDVALKSNSL